MLEVIDISMPLSEAMTAWPGNLPPTFPGTLRMAKGDSVNVTDCHLCAHTGTHVDAPFHHYAGAGGMETLPTKTLVGKAYVMDLTGPEVCIDAADLQPLDTAEPFDILLTRTRNSTEKDIWEGTFREDYIYISPGGAREMIRRGVRCVGVDCLSVEGFDNVKGETHKVLLADGAVTILEGLDLRKAEPGCYWFACLPLKIVGSDGAPARAILIKDRGCGFLAAWEAASEKTFR